MIYESCPHGIKRTRPSKDGLTAKCKKCLKLRDKNRANDPDRVAARKEYQKTDAYKKSHMKAVRKYGRSNIGKENCKKWQQNNPKKRKAHGIVAYRIKIGELVKSPCEVCGEKETHAHHDDYDKPLEVRWLCNKHHNDWHKENGEALNP